MSDPQIFQLAYASAHTDVVERPIQALNEILSASRQNNDRSEITGYLIFDGTTFVQILEGDQLAVLATYVRIEQDPRHRDVTIIGSQEIAQRRFGSWGMDGCTRSPKQDHIFHEHGIVRTMDRTHLSMSAAVELASALQQVNRPTAPNLSGLHDDPAWPALNRKPALYTALPA